MTGKEIVKALRCCKFGLPCEKCPAVGKKDCFEEVNTAAAELIERLTAENADLGKEIDWKQSRDSTLNVLINGPTSNGFGKDIFRKMARDLYGRLKAYEDTGLTPEEIKAPFTEDTMINLAAQALGVEPSRLREIVEAEKDRR